MRDQRGERKLFNNLDVRKFFKDWRQVIVINGYYQLLVKSMHKKVLKGTKWMPRRVLPMKDVEDCDKSRGAVNKLWSGNVRMGKPNTSYVVLLLSE